LTLTALLELPVLARARPEVVSGDALDTRLVRWVHSSEIYEISSLLQGGEVLLTTGLGLVALSPDARRAYIADLAQVGITALLLELGRTFPAAPEDLVSEARRVGLPLVLLHGVVPFIEVTQAAHAMILNADVEQFQLSALVTERLLHALGERVGLVGLTGVVGELAGCPVALCTIDGELAAGIAIERGDDPAATHRVPIIAGGVAWGELVLDTPTTERLRTIAASAAQVLAAEVARSGSTPLSRNQAGADLLRDLVAGRYGSTSELTSRALGTGLAVRPGQKVLALCVRPRTATTSANAVLIAAREAARRVFAGAIAAEYEGDVLVSAVVLPREVRAAVSRFADEVDSELRPTTGGGVLVSAGHVVDDIPALVAAFPSARETARLAMRLTPAARVVVAADFALYQLLASLVDDEALEKFVNDQLGALLAHDARTGAGLVMTLDAYLAAGLSKTRTAESLGIRRQTLYGRLERISRLLGGLDLDNRERRTALDLALVSWRLRVSAAVRA
jgi:purine catabolism regulator